MDLPPTSQPRKPLLSIWIHPRQTVREIVARDPGYCVILLACLSGIVNTLDRASIRSMGDRLSVPTIILLAVLVGPLGGLLTLWLGSHLIRWTGSWLGGQAPREHIKTAIAWASVPAVCTLLVWIVELPLFGAELFTTETPRIDASLPLLLSLVGLSLIEVTAGVWGAVLACHTIAEVQDFQSAWRGLGNIMLAGLVIVVPIAAVVILVLVFSAP